MDKVQKHNSFNTNTSSSESYKHEPISDIMRIIMNSFYYLPSPENITPPPNQPVALPGGTHTFETADLSKHNKRCAT
jgi:hypothetical protein